MTESKKPAAKSPAEKADIDAANTVADADPVLPNTEAKDHTGATAKDGALPTGDFAPAKDTDGKPSDYRTDQGTEAALSDPVVTADGTEVGRDETPVAERDETRSPLGVVDAETEKEREERRLENLPPTPVEPEVEHVKVGEREVVDSLTGNIVTIDVTEPVVSNADDLEEQEADPSRIVPLESHHGSSLPDNEDASPSQRHTAVQVGREQKRNAAAVPVQEQIQTQLREAGHA